jgi:hypothetical protein
VEKQWSLRFLLPIANVDEQSGVTRISEVLLTPGDFVEIDVEFDLVIDRKLSHGKMLKVHLAFNHLIRLSKARKPLPEIEVVVVSMMQTLFCRTECASIGW